MKSKILNLLLILTSLLGFLQWGKGNKLFLLQAEAEIITKLFTHPLTVLHPLTILPLLAQILLLVTIFQKKVSTTLTYFGIGGLSMLLLLMFVIGVMSVNLEIIWSTLPFLAVAVYTIGYHRQIKKQHG
ncbi:hypothetical protein [Ferruginibacter profundus]